MPEKLFPETLIASDSDEQEMPHEDAMGRSSFVLPEAKQSHPVSFEDKDGDGDLDIVVTPPSGQQYWVENTLGEDAHAVFTNPVFKHILPTAIGVGDIDGDGTTDLVVGHRSGAKYFLNNGDWSVHNVGAIMSHPSTIVVADVNEDGAADILVQDERGLTMFQNVDNTFGSITMSWPDLDSVPAIGVGNLDQTNAAMEIMTIQRDSGNLGLLSHNGDTWNSVEWTTTVAENTVTVADLNQDGINDIHIQDQDGNQVVISGTGSGSYVLYNEGTTSMDDDNETVSYTLSGDESLIPTTVAPKSDSSISTSSSQSEFNDATDTAAASQSSEKAPENSKQAHQTEVEKSTAEAQDQNTDSVESVAPEQNAAPATRSIAPEPDYSSYDLDASHEDVSFDAKELEVHHPGGDFGGWRVNTSDWGDCVDTQHYWFDFNIDPRGGDDFVQSGWEDDYISSGSGSDLVYAGYGNDTLKGDSGGDILFGEDGDDAIYGERGNDALYGGYGDDFISGGKGVDVLFGNDGNDSLTGGEKSDYLFGGDGDDVLYGGEGSDTLLGNEGQDTFFFSTVSSDYDHIGDFSMNDSLAFAYGAKASLIITDEAYTGSLDRQEGEAFVWEEQSSVLSILYYDEDVSTQGNEWIVAEIETPDEETVATPDAFIIV